jgi:V/A-type H+-transporting ATPase subunit I
LKLKVTALPARQTANLLLVFSLSTIIWGALTGNFFGLDSPNRPWFMKGIDFFTDPEVKEQNLQMFCFILAVLHLTTGRLWRAILCWNVPRRLLGEIGWAVVLWGNFFTTLKLLVFPGEIETFILIIYAVGFGLVILFGVNWLDAGEVFNFPFGAIGTFIDILSYIRLYAVGMAGFYIASSFNGMGYELMTLPVSPWLFPLFILFGLLVFLFGHTLNIALCLLGVLVHGVRLNALEFSNHFGLRWAGLEYKPFAKSNKSKLRRMEP